MFNKKEVYRYPIGSKCMHCGVVFAEVHPPSAIFINGYPFPCPKIGHPKIGTTIKEAREEFNSIPWKSMTFKEYPYKLTPEQERAHFKYYFGWDNFPSKRR